MNFTNTVKKYILLLLLFGYGFREKYNLYKFILGKKMYLNYIHCLYMDFLLLFWLTRFYIYFPKD